MSRPFPALVVKKTSPFELIINRGSLDGVEVGNTFLVYYIDPDELIDPETKESLGNLEIIRGTAVATHVQQKMTTIKSNRSESTSGQITRRNINPFGGISALIGGETIEQPMKNLMPFDEAKIEDKVKKY